MSIEEAVQYCKDKTLVVDFSSYGVLVKDTGWCGTSFWDTDFVDAVKQMKEYMED